MQQCLPQHLTGPRAAGLDCWAPGVASLGLKRPSAPMSPWRPSVPAPTPVLQRPEELVCGIHPGVPPEFQRRSGELEDSCVPRGPGANSHDISHTGWEIRPEGSKYRCFSMEAAKKDDLGIWGAIGRVFWGTWGWQRRSSLQCTRSLNLPDPGYFRVTVPLLSAEADLVI